MTKAKWTLTMLALTLALVMTGGETHAAKGGNKPGGGDPPVAANPELVFVEAGGKGASLVVADADGGNRRVVLSSGDVVTSEDGPLLDRPSATPTDFGEWTATHLEPLQALRVRHCLGRQDLERDPSAEPCVLRYVDLTHTAAGQALDDRVMGEPVAGHGIGTIGVRHVPMVSWLAMSP